MPSIEQKANFSIELKESAAAGHSALATHDLECFQDVTACFADGQRNPLEGETVAGLQLVDQFGDVGQTQFYPGQVLAVAEDLFGRSAAGQSAAAEDVQAAQEHRHQV